MTWLKIDKNVYARMPIDDEYAEIVDLTELEAEIAELQARVDGVVTLDYPAGADVALTEAIDKYNVDNWWMREELITHKERLEEKRSDIEVGA